MTPHGMRLTCHLETAAAMRRRRREDGNPNLTRFQVEAKDGCGVGFGYIMFAFAFTFECLLFALYRRACLGKQPGEQRLHRGSIDDS